MPKTRSELLIENKVYIRAILALLLILGIIIGFVWTRNSIKKSNKYCFPRDDVERICIERCNKINGVYIRFNETTDLCECIEIESKELLRTGALA
ncbi:MAG: hypothetical protein ACE5KD_00920 [Candidatus Bathyarchaeia archaeon]